MMASLTIAPSELALYRETRQRFQALQLAKGLEVDEAR
jgi:hypothetical protein